MNTPSDLRVVPISRRDVMRNTLFSAAGVLLGSRLATASPAVIPAPAKAKSVIQIWMWGGPPHLDTFDPKPDAGDAYSRSLATILRIFVGSRASLEAMTKAIAAERLRPIIDRVFPFAEAREAYTYFAGGDVFGKVVIAGP